MRLLLRLLLILLVLVTLAAVAIGTWVLTHRDQARAYRQTAVITGVLAGGGGASSLTGLLASDTTSPRAATAGTLPATVVSPDDGERAHPAIILLVPGGTSDAELARVRELQDAIASAGLNAWAVRAPRLADAFGSDAAPDAIADAIAAVATDPSTRGRHASVLATGPTATLTLLAAGTQPARDHVRAIVAVAPIGDVQAFARFAVTGTTRDAAGIERATPIDPELRADAARAIIDAVRANLSPDAGFASSVLRRVGESDDPVATFAALPLSRMSPVLATTRILAGATTPAQFDAAWDDLPASIRTSIETRSPITFADDIDARVLLVVPRDPAHWASIEAGRLDAVLPDARTHATRRLGESDAVDPALDASSVDELREAFGVSAWWLQRAGA